MQETTLRKVIRYFGSINKMAYKIGVSRATIYRYLDGSSIPADIAFRIETISKGKFNYKTLIPWKTKYNLELDTFPSTLMSLQLKSIVIPEKIPYFIDRKNLSLHEHRAICVDEDNRLIYGLEAIESCKKQEKKTVLAWRISLLDLLSDKYEIDILKKTFHSLERAAIGIALESFIGNRQGQRTDLVNSKPKGLIKQKLRLSLGEVKGRTDKFIATLLGISSKDRYRQLKQVLQFGCPDLINQVRKKELAISKAANLVKISI